MSSVPAIPPIITRRLSALRRSVRFWLLLWGLGICCITLAACVYVSLGLDYYWRWDRFQRGIILFATIAGLAVLVYRQLIRPLLRPLSDDALALRVEAVHPELGQSLISALQLSRMGGFEALGVSGVLVDEAIRQGAAGADRVRFADALSALFRKQALARLGIGVALLASVLAFFTIPATAAAMQLWYQRNILLGAQRWPQRTHLRLTNVEGARVTIPRGDDWELLVQADGVTPAAVYVDIESLSDGDDRTEEMTQVGGDAFRATFRGVLEPLRFRVYGGDDVSQWIELHLVDRPRITELKLTYHPPKYTGQPAAQLPTGQASYDVLKGGSIDIAATANKPLASAKLMLGDAAIADLTLTGQGDQAMGFIGQIPADKLASGAWGMMLVDVTGLEARRPQGFTLHVAADRKPQVRAKLQGISAWVTSRAVVPINLRLTDDFAVAAADRVYYTVAKDTQEQSPPVAVPLAELGGPFGQREMAGTHVFDLAPLNLIVGTQVVFAIQARDNDDVSGPNVGASPNFPLMVVTEEELRAELLRREQEQRQEFERLIKDQEELLTDVRAVMVTVQGKAQLEDADRTLLLKTEKRQRLVADRAMTIAGHFTSILEEVVNNKLEEESGPAQQRLRDSIIQPMRDLARLRVPPPADLIELARTPTAAADQRDKALADASQRQVKLVDEMQAILRFMEKWEGYQEAINLLHEILKAQGDVGEETLREYKRRVEQDIFGK
ncbi:MAG: hypothetical protein WD042_14345 [Phycisphaeraceae bacterium]